ncbi:MAG: hypothetical protein JNK37_04705 [Verrucomicrobiales bacterium]|nr:hypothetical protein [Verrucomicrobiales bacterium]
MARNSQENCCFSSCLFLFCGIGVSIALLINFFTNKIRGNYFVKKSNVVYSEPIETGGRVAEIVGLAAVVGAPKEERGGWSLVDLHGMSGWVKTSSLTQVSWRADENEMVVWAGNNTQVGRVPGLALEAVLNEFFLEFGDELYPYALTRDRVYYYTSDHQPCSFNRSTVAAAPVKKLDEGRILPFTDSGDQYVTKDCNFYHLNAATGKLSIAGMLPAGYPITLFEPHFSFSGRTPDIRFVMRGRSRSQYPYVVRISETSVTTTKPGIIPERIPGID